MKGRKTINVKSVLSVILTLVVAVSIMCVNVSAADIQYTDNVIPAMTSNSTPSGIASADSEFSSSQAIWHAFDHSVSGYDYAWQSANTSLPHWIGYEFTSAKKITKYIITASVSGCERAAPKSWTFEGSNDGINWTVLDTRSDVANWGASEKRSYLVNNNNGYKKYRIVITKIANTTATTAALMELEMMESVTPDAPSNLAATAEKSKVELTWASITGATGYNVKRSTTAGGPYTTVVTNVTTTSYTDTSVSDGNTYYYVVTAVTSNGESSNSNEVSTTIATSIPTLTSTASATKVKIGDEFTTDIVIHNVTNICAEDIKVSYDASLFEYVGSIAQTGIKIYKEDTSAPGTVRFIVACMGKDNVATGDKNLIQLKFKAKARGTGKVDIVKGRIADNATLEMDVADENCGEATIEVGGNDVNRTDSFTLLDLGIDAYYFGFNAADTDTSKYDADLDSNGKIDDADLASITESILLNKDYPLNNL